MNFTDALIQVAAIIGIIIAGGFLIFFIGDLMLAVIDPDNTRSARKKRAELEKLAKKEQKYVKEDNYVAVEPKLIEHKTEEQIKNDEIREINYQKALEEERVLNEKQNTIDDSIAKLRQEEEAFKNEKLKYGVNSATGFAGLSPVEPEKPKEEKSDEINLDDLFFDDDDDDFNFDDLDLDDDESEEKVEEPELVEEAQETVENEIEIEGQEDEEEVARREKEEKDALEAEQEARRLEQELWAKEEARKLAEVEEKLNTEAKEREEQERLAKEKEEQEKLAKEQEEKERLEREEQEKFARQQQEEQEQAWKKQIEELRNKLNEKEKEIAEIEAKANDEKQKLVSEMSAKNAKVAGPTLSLEEYEERLEVLQERLRVNQKEYNRNKKEYLPLLKVKNSLESDKKKLRRKEAIVAKQKVMLYGVNNIGDIDEEKAKKLAEELDLLDGLRLSVQHCEEVIKNNSERYPILEKTYEILKRTNEDLKEDIAETEAAIEKLKKENE